MGMDAVYPAFARADPVFYDHPATRARASSDVSFEIGPAPSWRHVDDGIWHYHQPPDVALLEQGWKIHLSTTLTTAHQLLHTVSAYCLGAGLAFKHLSSESVLAASNSKDSGRGGSGKFVTIYPTSDIELERAITDLGRRTAAFEGPHILSDLRWREGPVFVRYGGFESLFIDVGGVNTAAIRHPDGHLVPDPRQPGFTPPSWAPVPEFLQPLVDDLLDRRPPEQFPLITGVLHHSNAGGVYAATDAGRDVVVKEARPHAGLTPDGMTAVERAHREAAVLRALPGEGTARLIREFGVFGHRYLVLERARGMPLHQAVMSRHPLVSAKVDEAAVDAYREWALRLGARIRTVLTALHAVGFSHGDIHPANFLVDEDGEVTLIDFEMARPVGEDAPALIGAPGFVAADGRGGVASDTFALSRLLLFLFAPLAPLLDIHPAKEPQLQAWVATRFRLTAEQKRTLGCDREVALGPGADLGEIAAQLLADATPARTDRLWPGDPAQFDEPAYGLAHGGFGPLVALHAARGAVPSELVRWCLDAVRDAPGGAGLMDGLAGAAASLQSLGWMEDADQALGRCLETPLRWNAPGLYSGPAGTALVMLRFADRHPGLASDARRIFDNLAERAGGWERRPSDPVATGAAGLLRGPSGVALLAMALFDRCGDGELLALAEAAIASDIARCTPAVDGSLQVNEGWRLLPYLGSGSTGISYALTELKRRNPSTLLGTSADALRRAGHPELVMESGLFQGRVGLMLGLAHSGVAADALLQHQNLLSLHAVTRPVGTGYPGRSLLRLSCDLATGSAGVLWALSSIRDGQRLTLPFIDLPPVDGRPQGTHSRGGGEHHGIPALFADAEARGDGAQRDFR